MDKHQTNETLEERVARLEYYIHHLRDCIVAPDRFFPLWDWTMSYSLNQEETLGLIGLAKELDLEIRDKGTSNNYPSLEELRSKIKSIVYEGRRDGFKIKVTDAFMRQFLNNLKKMELFKTFIAHYLNELEQVKE